MYTCICNQKNMYTYPENIMYVHMYCRHRCTVISISMLVFSGLGWAMAMISILVAIYYNMIVGWVLLYLFETVTGRLRWNSCQNYWNTAGL
jgi:SNF family Na+-dependent transporter